MSHIDLDADLENQQARIDALEAQLTELFDHGIDSALTEYGRMAGKFAEAKRQIERFEVGVS